MYKKPKQWELFNIIQILEHHNNLSYHELFEMGANRYKKLGSDAKTPKQSISGNVIQRHTKLSTKGEINKEFIKHGWNEFFINNNNVYSLTSNWKYKIDINDYKKFKAQFPFEENNHNLNEEVKNIQDKDDKTAIIKIRVNQQPWAKKLKKKHKRCAICGIGIWELLIAGHIVPYSKSTEKRYKDSNGIVFCVFHDKLFEIGDISFDKDKYLIYQNKDSYKECLKIIEEYDQTFNITKQEGFNKKNIDIKLPSTYDEWWEEIYQNILEKNSFGK